MIEQEILDAMPRQFHYAYLNQKMGFDDWLCECSDNVRAEAMDAGIEFMNENGHTDHNRSEAMKLEWGMLEQSYNEYLEGGVR